MEQFWKAIVLALISCVLCLALEKQNKDFAILLTLAAAVMLALCSLQFLQPVVTLVKSLADFDDLPWDILSVLIKALGIGMTAQIAQQVCTDSGNGSIGKVVEMLSSIVVLYLSVPMFQTLIELLRQIMEEL